MNLEHVKWLTPDLYSSWLNQNQIINYIYLENPHPELIKRSKEILQLMAINEKFFTPLTIDFMWACCSTDKHEDVVRTTLHVIAEITPNIP